MLNIYIYIYMDNISYILGLKTIEERREGKLPNIKENDLVYSRESPPH